MPTFTYWLRVLCESLFSEERLWYEAGKVAGWFTWWYHGDISDCFSLTAYRGEWKKFTSVQHAVSWWSDAEEISLKMLDYCCIIIISLLLSLNILPLVAEQNSALLVVGKFSDDTKTTQINISGFFTFKIRLSFSSVNIQKISNTFPRLLRSIIN